MDDATLSIHRLIQAAVQREMSEKDQVEYFDRVVRILIWGFPDHWRKDKGHQFQTWTKCEQCLPHVHHLVKQAERYKVSPGDVQLYAELLLRASWYGLFILHLIHRILTILKVFV